MKIRGCGCMQGYSTYIYTECTEVLYKYATRVGGRELTQLTSRKTYRELALLNCRITFMGGGVQLEMLGGAETNSGPHRYRYEAS